MSIPLFSEDDNLDLSGIDDQDFILSFGQELEEVEDEHDSKRQCFVNVSSQYAYSMANNNWYQGYPQVAMPSNTCESNNSVSKDNYQTNLTTYL
jgi:hypothetical protein